MTRQIVCRKCGVEKILKPLPVEDKAAGWSQRFEFLIPDAFRGLHCDLCNVPLGDQISMAFTTWRPAKEDPANWERTYGTLVPFDTVQMTDTLTKDEHQQ